MRWCTLPSGTSIEEGRERQVTSYLRQWTQLIRPHGRGVTPVQPYSCPEMCLYWQDYSRPCSLISWVLLAQIWRQQPPCHSLYITYYFMAWTVLYSRQNVFWLNMEYFNMILYSKVRIFFFLHFVTSSHRLVCLLHEFIHVLPIFFLCNETNIPIFMDCNSLSRLIWAHVFPFFYTFLLKVLSNKNIFLNNIFLIWF